MREHPKLKARRVSIANERASQASNEAFQSCIDALDDALDKLIISLDVLVGALHPRPTLVKPATSNLQDSSDTLATQHPTNP